MKLGILDRVTKQIATAIELIQHMQPGDPRLAPLYEVILQDRMILKQVFDIDIPAEPVPIPLAAAVPSANGDPVAAPDSSPATVATPMEAAAANAEIKHPKIVYITPEGGQLIFDARQSAIIVITGEGRFATQNQQ
jgi:hypothetical protein